LLGSGLSVIAGAQLTGYPVAGQERCQIAALEARTGGAAAPFPG